MSDYMIRATAANGQIRAFAATTRDLTEYARNAHNTSPVVTAALGRTMTAAVMMGSMLKGDKELLTVKIQGDGPIGSLTVTADSHGHVYWSEGSVCGTDRSCKRRDCRGFDILFCCLRADTI